MDLILASSSCFGGDLTADIGMDLLALGAVGLLFALKWHESRWFSAQMIAWLLSLALIDLAPAETPVLAQIVTVIRSSPTVIVCGLVALMMPLLAPAPIEWQIVFPRRGRRGAVS
jgi:hypothetical protein